MATFVLDNSVEQYARQLERVARPEPPALSALRRSAMDRFCELGFPTPKDEEWRGTNVGPIARRLFEPASAGNVSLDDLGSLRVANLESHRMVFVDGHFVGGLSALKELPAGVNIEPVSHRRDADAVLDEDAARLSDPFEALNLALHDDGALIRVEPGVVLDRPIEILSIATHGGSATHPHNRIRVGKNAQVQIVEHYAALTGEEYLTNAVTRIDVGERAHVIHYFLEEEGPRAFCIATLRAQMARASSFESHTVLLGGSLVRNNVDPVLGEGCDCLVNGLYLANGRQHMDNHMRVEHARPNSNSRQFYRGILDDHSQGVFSGRIVVRPGAQKTDAKQSNMNLLLSKDASADSKPQLEIYADDVKCTHGATIGQIDTDAMFYLRSRGIDATTARRLLIRAFASDSLHRMGLESVRNHFEQLLSQRFSNRVEKEMLS